MQGTNSRFITNIVPLQNVQTNISGQNQTQIMQTNILTLQTSVAALQKTVEGLQTAIQTMQADILALQTRVATLV